MIRTDLQTLQLFILVCEACSVTRVAARAHIAASALSRRLQLLEQEAAVPLLRRRPHGVEPTPAGLAVLRYARSVLSLGDQLAATLDEHRTGQRGQVRVVASSTALVRRLAADLSGFLRENEGIAVELEEQPSSIAVNVLRGRRADVGAVVADAPAEDLVLTPYATDRLVVVVPAGQPLAGAGAVTLAEIAGQDLVTLDADTATYQLVARKAREAGHRLRIRMQVRSFDTLCHVAAQGLAIGVLPDHAARPLAAGLGLAMVPLQEPWAWREIAIALRKGEEPAPPVRRLLSWLLERRDREANGVMLGAAVPLPDALPVEALPKPKPA